MDGACLETHPVTQSVQGGEELLRASRTSDSTHPTPPLWRLFCGSDTGSCAEVGLKGPVT